MSIAPWSFSKIKSFEQCARQFQHLKILKTYKESESEAMLYGTAFHTAAEEYIQDETPMPPQFAYAKDALDNLNAKRGDKLCEYKMGLTENLEPCDFLAVFKFFPNIKTVRGGLLFVVSNELIKGNYVSLDQGHLWEKWLGGYTKLETAFKNDVWNPNPSGLCRAHCLVLECEHNGRRS